MTQRVLLCFPQVPFVRGGAELHVELLAGALREQAYQVDTIALPFIDWPHEALVQSAALWRMLELEKLSPPADFVIATKFPSYFVSHPSKLVWVFHNYRQIYDLYDTEYSGYSRPRSDDFQLIRWIVEHDREYLQECKKIFANSENVRNRLMRFLGIDSEVLYPPPPREDQYYCSDYEPFVLMVQRLDSYKRTDLVIDSFQYVDGDYSLWIVGTGPEEARLRDLIKARKLENRVKLLGHVSDDELLQYYARCRLVVYVPFDEDFGFTTVEAFKAQKPVLTATDSGGPLEFVDHLVNGWVASPQGREIAIGIQTILDQPQLARSLGESGFRKAQSLSWKNVAKRFQEVFADLQK